ncbi:MAG: alpha/beta hydrolase [Bacteroidales bacterium]|nr:alpha/beta hydrolase [Bacteroidales bacterium]
MPINKILFNDINIEFSVEGEGKVIVLLHGYMESLSVWEDFGAKLAENYKVISIDLPGHGNSGVIQDVHSMQIMAEVVDEVMVFLQIDKFTLIGHSMGGYVTLEYLSKYPEKIEAYCLFHSTPFADTDEKKEERERIVDLIHQGKKVQLAKNHVEKTFADKNINIFAGEIGFLKVIAVNTPDNGIVAALRGMKDRKDHFETMILSKAPSLWIFGRKDNFIGVDSVSNIQVPSKCKIIILENSGHQGYIEEQKYSMEVVADFLEQI